MAPQLVRLTLEGSTSRHPINKLPFSIGRHPDNDLVLPVDWVSRHHTSIEGDGASLVAVDLQSTHHTFINGKKIIRLGLSHGDVLTIGGEIAFVFLEREDEPMIKARGEALVSMGLLSAGTAPEDPASAPGPAGTALSTPGAPAAPAAAHDQRPAPVTVAGGASPVAAAAAPASPPPAVPRTPMVPPGPPAGASAPAPARSPSRPSPVLGAPLLQVPGREAGVARTPTGAGAPAAPHTVMMAPAMGHGLAASFDETVGPMLGQLRASGVGDDLLGKLQSAIGRLRREVEVLIEVGEAITTELELDKVLELIVTHVLKATGAERGFLLLKEKTTGKLLTSVARSGRGDLDEKERSKLSMTICQRAIDSHQPVVSMDTSAEGSVTRSIVDYNIRSAIAAPLTARSEDLGVLYVDAHQSMRSFTPKDMDFFQALANQSAIAISNARQYVQVVAEKQELERKVQQLKVQVDERERERQVAEITESDYFQALADKAAQIRKKL